MTSDEVVVVGAGIAGVACARVLHDADLPVVVRDRGRRIGGRLAVRTLSGRPVDLGASYFTVSHEQFRAVVEEWQRVGLARPWTDTFHVATPEGLIGTKVGPVRYGTQLGLRSLVEALAVRLAVSNPDEVHRVSPGPRCDDADQAVVVLAMPGPQAVDVLDERLVDARVAADHVWEPCLSMVTCWAQRVWPQLDGVFVHDSPVLTWIADDGRRRGDDAPVLVAHSTPVLAAEYLDDPRAATGVMLSELRAVLGIVEDPSEVLLKRWSLAKPVRPQPQPFFMGEHGVALCGDGWHGPSRVESAFLSGHLLGRALVTLLRG